MGLYIVTVMVEIPIRAADAKAVCDLLEKNNVYQLLSKYGGNQVATSIKKGAAPATLCDFAP